LTVKNSLYQGGINTPCFVSGAGVSRRGEDASLLTATDLFATIAEMCGVDDAATSSTKSFFPLLSAPGQVRDYQYSLLGSGSEAEYAVSDGTYKLIVREGEVDELYHLVNDPYESANLVGTSTDTETATAYSQLKAALNTLR
jgi:arylsulfatase A-like enzyme